ncbi:hypothetical protein E4U11_004334 [Claviceps purpurea]|nr:hypothetical protein E4U11_004334 [Claviceps purpurea]
MPRKCNWASAKTPPTRQRQQRQTTHLGKLDTTPTRPDASPAHSPNGVYEQSIRLNKDSDAFEDGLEDGGLVELVDTQAVPNDTVSKDFPWSETGSGARRSSVTENHLSKSLGTSSHRGFADRFWMEDKNLAFRRFDSDLNDAYLAFRSSAVAHHRQRRRDDFFFVCFWTLILFFVAATTGLRDETGKLGDGWTLDLSIWVALMWGRLVQEALGV